MKAELDAIQPLSETSETSPDTKSKSKHKRSPAFMAYPEGHKGHPSPGVEVELSSDELFSILFGPQSVVGEKSRKSAGSKDYWESLWYPSQEQAFASLKTHAENFESGKHGDLYTQSSVKPSGERDILGESLQGRVRVNVCHQRQLGREAYTFERERCLKAAAGGLYELEICVRSTAVSAERFRCVFLHRIEPLGPKRSRWSVIYDIFFVEKTNFIVKAGIETGAHSAIRRNTETMQKTVKECAAELIVGRAA